MVDNALDISASDLCPGPQVLARRPFWNNVDIGIVQNLVIIFSSSSIFAKRSFYGLEFLVWFSIELKLNCEFESYCISMYII